MAGAFSVSFAEIDAAKRYKLLTASVIPRPIAFVTTLGPGGIVNAAPFSFFNVFSPDPALVVIGIEGRAGRSKDTAANIRARQAFVVNVVDEPLAEAMNLCAADFPPDASEVEAAGLETLPSDEVPVPRLAAAPFAMECRHHTTLGVGEDRSIVVGEVVRFHAREGLVDPATLRVDLSAWKPVGRLFANLYSRQDDLFELRRETYAEWSARTGRVR